MRSDLGWSFTLTRSHSCSCALKHVRDCSRRACRFHDKGVDLKRVPPKSRRPPLLSKDPSEDRSPIEEAVSKDSAVHVSLSSYSPVKQPGTMAIPPSGSRKAVEA